MYPRQTSRTEIWEEPEYNHEAAEENERDEQHAKECAEAGWTPEEFEAFCAANKS